ncbi:MAG: hypothetical protein JNM55_17650 [Anaerolineales bacterium]|nr:hypothetical protein [Anaerolineales bacterium]
MSQAPVSSDITQDDKLWAMLSYLIPVIAVVVLFMEDKKNRPYVKFSAVQSIVVTVLISIIATVTFGCGAILVFAQLYWAYQAYQGQDIKVPFVSDFIRNQGWA